MKTSAGGRPGGTFRRVRPLVMDQSGAKGAKLVSEPQVSKFCSRLATAFISTSSTCMVPVVSAPEHRKTTWALAALVGAVPSTEYLTQLVVSAPMLAVASSPMVFEAASSHSILICMESAVQLAVALSHAEAR